MKAASLNISHGWCLQKPCLAQPPKGWNPGTNSCCSSFNFPLLWNTENSLWSWALLSGSEQGTSNICNHAVSPASLSAQNNRLSEITPLPRRGRAIKFQINIFEGSRLGVCKTIAMVFLLFKRNWCHWKILIWIFGLLLQLQSHSKSFSQTFRQLQLNFCVSAALSMLKWSGMENWEVISRENNSPRNFQFCKMLR